MTYLSLTLLGISVLVLWIAYAFCKKSQALTGAFLDSLLFIFCLYSGVIYEHNYKIISTVNKDYYCIVNENGRAYVIPNNDISIGVGDSFTMTDCEFNKKYPNMDVTNIEIN